MRKLIDIKLSDEAMAAGTAESFKVGVKNAKDDEPAEIAIYGEIGNPWEGLDSASVGRFLRENKGCCVNVRINSMGGLAYDGITIHNALVSHDAQVTTIIEGMAGSAASIIAMAGEPVQMFDNASLFIHRALLMAVGNRDVMADAIDWLDKLDESIAKTYKAKTNMAIAKIRELMKGKLDGTMFTAQEAKSLKFVDEILSPKNGEYRARAMRDVLDCGAMTVEEIRASEGPKRLHELEDSRMRRLRARREDFAFFPQNVCPMNPDGGDGVGMEGEWDRPTLSDFTDKQWGDLGMDEKRNIGKHFAYYPNLDTFGELHLPHHWPSGKNKGKPSIVGVRVALARLNQVQGMSDSDRSMAEAHLRAHMADD